LGALVENERQANRDGYVDDDVQLKLEEKTQRNDLSRDDNNGNGAKAGDQDGVHVYGRRFNLSAKSETRLRRRILSS
jgi:hypothetical protein